MVQEAPTRKPRQSRSKTNSPSLPPRLSSTGLQIWAGRIFEDYLVELRGKQAINVYNEMRKGNPIVGGFMRATEMAFRSVNWNDIPYEESPEGLKRAAFLTSVRNDMRHSWADVTSNITTVLPFGHAPFEMTFKIRSGRPDSIYKDNKIGLKNLDLIPQDTIERWDVDAANPSEVIGIIQRAPPVNKEVTIPMEKVVNFRLRLEKDNPEGESILRQAYRPWYFMNNLEAIEGISLERTGAGIPTLKLPKGATTYADKGAQSDEYAAIEIVKQVRVDEQGGIVLFEGWEFILTRPEGRVDPDLFDLAIKRHRSNMLISVLAAFLEFGTARVGSFALAEQSRSFFEVALEGYVNIVEECFNKFVVPLLFELNGITDGKLPKLAHTTVGDPELQKIANYVTQLTGSGHLSPDPILDEYLKDLARFPKGRSITEREAIRTKPKEPEEEPDGEFGHNTNGSKPSSNGASPDIEDENEKRLAKKKAARKLEEE